MTDPIAADIEYQLRATTALASGDWHGAYLWAKGWIGRGGGAWIVDPWLVYAASALLHRQPRGAIRALDLALGHWIAEASDRAILLWVRGEIVRRRLQDPESAMADLDPAATDAPTWLARDAAASREAGAIEARARRKRKPTIEPAPSYQGPGTAADTVARRESPRPGGTRPSVWDSVIAGPCPVEWWEMSDPS